MEGFLGLGKRKAASSEELRARYKGATAPRRCVAQPMDAVILRVLPGPQEFSISTPQANTHGGGPVTTGSSPPGDDPPGDVGGGPAPGP